MKDTECCTLLVYLGGAFAVGSMAHGGFWDALIWPYYIGRFLANSFVLLH